MAAETAREGATTGAHMTPVDAPVAPDTTMAAPDAGPACDRPTGRVWGALTGNPGATVAAIAMAAGVSKTAARKALIALEADGHATRAAGGHDGGKRAPDTWHPARPDDAGETDDTGMATGTDTPQDGAGGDLTEAATAGEVTAPTQTGTDASGDHPAAPATAPSAIEETEPVTDTTTDEADEVADTASVTHAPDAGGHDDGRLDGMEAVAVAEAIDALTGLGEVIGSAVQALQAGDRVVALSAAEVIYTGSGKTRRLVRAAADQRPRSASGRPKSQPGELRAKVTAHLAAHPELEFTPHEIGKALGHSAGAVANALDRLISLGEAVETCDRPRRFTATATGDTTNTATGEETPNGTATADDPQAATR